MSKLTDRQKKQLITEYIAGDGNISQRTLAVKYHISQKTVSKILSDSNVTQKVLQKKEENTKSMFAFLDEQTALVQEIIGKILSSANKDICKSPLRDRMGALKILHEVFGKKEESGAEEKPIDIHISIEDCSDDKNI